MTIQEPALRITGSIPLAAAALALALSVGACGDASTDKAANTTSAASTSTVQSSAAQIPTFQPPSATPVAISCTTSVAGLAVFAVTTKGSAACPTAVAVSSSAYGEQSGPPSKGTRTVTVEGVSWTCQERQGQVNPYKECESNAEPAEKVRLSS
ncbi:hypothetical protein [Nocardia sp. NPDC057030]|uniref:hypothetical protein n=1 Tax=unclassified Nocardia TaxID=2637762 RepID=UPI00362D075D